MHQRSYGLSVCRYVSLFDRLKETFGAVELNKTECSWECPDNIVTCHFRNLLILLQLNENCIDVEEK